MIQIENKKIKKILRPIVLSVAIFYYLAESGVAATGFGSRKDPPKPEAQSTSVKSTQSSVPSRSPIMRSFNPPSSDGVEWLRVPFHQAENQVLELFQRDLPKLEEKARKVAVFETKVSGPLPSDYRRHFRAKLERTLLTSKYLKIKQCQTCEQARVYRDEKGEVKYESSSSDLSRPAKIASEIDVDHFLYAEINYTPEDLQMRIRMANASTGELQWAKDYSTADIVKTRENLNDADSDELGHRDSLARVLIGEVAFTTVLSFGVGILPTIDKGSGTGVTGYPSVDLLLGEKFDRGRKVFGFLIGGTFTMGESEGQSGREPLPWALRVAPRFKYVFNPYNIVTARYSIAGEIGGFISSGLATAYVGLGPEIAMIKRFSVSLTPVYIFPASIKGTQVFNESSDGSFTSAGTPNSNGRFGGFGVLMKANLNW